MIQDVTYIEEAIAEFGAIGEHFAGERFSSTITEKSKIIVKFVSTAVKKDILFDLAN